MAITQSWSGYQSCFVFGGPGSILANDTIILKCVVVSVKPSEQILVHYLPINWTQAVMLPDFYSWSARFESQQIPKEPEVFCMNFVSHFLKIPLKHIKLDHDRFFWHPSQLIYRGTDKSLARPATAKLLQATQKQFRRLSVQPGLRGSNDLRVGRKMANFQLFFQSGLANDLSALLYYHSIMRSCMI
jgi:hypothetical protein